MYISNVTNFDINQIAESGQCFRFKKIRNNKYSIIAFDKYVEVKQINYTLIFSCSKKEYEETWKPYFDMEINYSELIVNSMTKDISIIFDKFLNNAIDYSHGIRILRQEFFEMLISFIISQRKNISAIKTCIEKLCNKYGNKISGISLSGEEIIAYSFPTAETLSQLTIEELKEIGVGYRAEYIIEASKWYCSNKDFDKNKNRSYQESLSELMKIKGVGTKVANCVCLFGLHHMCACPIDVWMQKVIDKDYNGDVPKWMHGDNAGLLQQYVFYYKRNNCQ